MALDNDNIDYGSLAQEETELASIEDKELETYCSTNALQDFLRAIKRYSKPTPEENLDLYEEAIKGDSNARNMLIEKNLRLVVALAYRNRRKLKSYEIIDVVQDGTIGLMTAIDKYDPSRNTRFSTFAVYWIKQAMGRGIDNFDKTIKLPVHILEKQRKYITLKNDFINKGEVLPSDDEWLEILETTKYTFNIIKNAQQLEVDSLNRTIDDDDERSEIGNFVKAEEPGYDFTLNKMVDDELMFFLKKYFDSSSYYILYHMVLSKDKKKDSYIVKMLGISRQRVHQILDKNLEKLRHLYRNGNFKIRDEYKGLTWKELENTRLEPIEPTNIAIYLYVKDILTESEKVLLKAYYFGKEKDFIKSAANTLNWSVRETQGVFDDVIKKVAEIVNKEKGLLRDFFDNLRERFGRTIFDVSLELDISEFKKSSRFSYYRWKDKTYDDLCEAISAIGWQIPKELEVRLKLFFNYFKGNLHPSDLEVMFNRINLDMDRSDRVPSDKLHMAFYENIDCFDEQQQARLKLYFGEMTNKDFRTLYPNANYKVSDHLTDKLNLLYFGLRSYRNYNFNRQKYLAIRNDCFLKMEGYYIGILDTFFGYETGKPISQKELANKLGLSLERTKEVLRTAKKQAGNVLADVSYTMPLDISIYRSYLLKNKIKFSEPTRTIVWDFIINGKSYPEIAEEVGYNTWQVSNALTDALWKIDKYRFGFNVNLKKYGLKEAYDFIDINNLRKILLDNHVPIDDVSKYFLRTIFGIDMVSKTEEELAKEMNVRKSSVVRRVQRALILIKRYQGKEISGSISYEDDVVPNLKYFTKRDQEVLNMYYRDKLYIKEIAEKPQITRGEMQGLFNRIRIYLMDILNGEKGFDFNYFWEHLNDEEVPLYGNRNMALQIFILYYEESVGAKELAKRFNIDESAIMRILLAVSIAFSKRKEGIKKIRDFSLAEVTDYFNEHKCELSDSKIRLYRNYIMRLSNPSYVSTKCSLSFPVLYDLSKSSPNFTRLKDYDKNELQRFVMRNKDRFTEKYLNSFANYIGISPREFMNGKEKNQIISFLMRVDEAILLRRNQGVMRVRKNEQ